MSLFPSSTADLPPSITTTANTATALPIDDTITTSAAVSNTITMASASRPAPSHLALNPWEKQALNVRNPALHFSLEFPFWERLPLHLSEVTDTHFDSMSSLISASLPLTVLRPGSHRAWTRSSIQVFTPDLALT